MDFSLELRLFFIAYIKWATKHKKLFQNCHSHKWLQRKIYTLDYTSELINKWLDETCDESESEIKVSENSGTYFSNESDIKTIDAVAAHELLYDSVSLWEPLYIDVGNESVTESLQKKER